MKQTVALSIDPVAQIEVVEINSRRILPNSVKLKVTDQSGERFITLQKGDTWVFSFTFGAGVG